MQPLGVDTVKKVAALFLITLSLSTLHYTAFILNIPENLRPLLGLSFKLSFVSGLIFIGTFSIVSARYLPVLLLAVFTMIISVTIEYKYTKRGYRRAKLHFAAFYDGRITDQEARDEFIRKIKFGRNEARIHNLTSNIIHTALPVLWYEKNKMSITSGLATLVFLFYYIGLISAVILTFFSVILFSALLIYYTYDDGYSFKIFGYTFNDTDDSTENFDTGMDLDNLLTAAVVAAVIAGVSGHLRMQNVLNGKETTITDGGSLSQAILIGVTSNGVLIYKDTFAFRSFQGLQIKH